MKHFRFVVRMSIGATMLFFFGCIFGPSDSDKDKDEPSKAASNADSLFTVLVERIQTLDSVESYDEFAATDFTSLKNGFSTAISGSPDNVKANVGFIVSSLLSLNTSQGIEKLADSLDKYFSAVDKNSDTVQPLNDIPVHPVSAGKRLMHKAFHKEGILGLGKALAAKTSTIARAQTVKPSFPQFVTLNYIQQIAESEIAPVLDAIVPAAQRLEKLSDVTLPIIIEDNGEYDTFEFDKGEVYVADAMCHLTRAFIGMFCAYDMDLYAPQTQNYCWIDSVINSEENDSTIIFLSNDTLYRLYKYDNAQSDIYWANMFKYNLERSGFMTIRKQNHAKVKTDLIAVTDLVTAGIGSIRNESDNQDNDIIKMSSIGDADRNLADLKTDMLDEGVSPALANKFASPEAIAGFVKELLSGPYTFTEDFDKVHFSLKVNLAAWFDNPVNDLRTLLPKYTWTSENAWIVGKEKYRNASMTSGWDSSFYVDKYEMPTSVRIPDSNIIRIVPEDWGTKYVVDRAIYCYATLDSSVYLDPLRLVDNDGIVITPEQIDLQTDQGTFFPYFNDYTFHGLFPEMTTRQAWIDMIYQ